MSTKPQPKDMANNQWLRAHGYKSMHDFMIQYGFKPFSPDEKEDAERLLESMKDDDQEEHDKRERQTQAGENGG